MATDSLLNTEFARALASAEARERFDTDRFEAGAVTAADLKSEIKRRSGTRPELVRESSPRTQHRVEDRER